jgi:hypothetical protein
MDAPKVVRSNTVNPLNFYSSYNYIFTLASLRKDALSNPESYRDSNNFFVIAKSSGKGTKGISNNVSAINRVTGSEVTSVRDRGGNIVGENKKDIITSDKSVGTALVDSFNKNSPGRFDFYINNVRIETLMGFNEQTNLSVATKLEFDVIEPYSMSGFIEALQVSAVAAGYDQYASTPYLLKMEFIGYPDGEEISEKAQSVPNSTRYFVINFTGLDIDVTENGAKYKCKCVPFNERAFGEPSRIKSGVKIKGNTVGEILKNLEAGLNESKKSDTANERDPSQSNNYDSYEIIYPEVDETGIVDGSTNKTIAESPVVELLKSNAIYAFGDPASTDSKSSPTDSVIMFAENANVHECIVSIIRDSNYVKDILKDLSNANSKAVDQYGMVNYFIVNVEMIDKGIVDNKTNKPFYTYRYVVLPYKIHCTRIPLMQNQTIDTTKFLKIANRTYNYLYTGANIDIKSFRLNFNTLFFQAIPKALGNKQDRPTTSESVEGTDPVKTNLSSTSSEDRKGSSNGKAAVIVDINQTAVHVGNQPNAAQRNQSDPYDALAKNMHQAILDNVDQCSAEMEIIGDPFYLVTGSMGNYRPKKNPDGTSGDGEASYTSGDVMIVIFFKNPIDIDETTGEAIFSDRVTPYSGVFRVVNVTHTFIDGNFIQKLSMLRVPGQLGVDTNVAKKSRGGIVESVANPSQANTEIPAEPPNTVRASADNLATSIATQLLPSTGLPGSLSKLASSVGGTLAGVTAGVTALGTLRSIASGGSGSALAGLTNIDSTLRLASAGLSNLSTNINSAGASISQLTDTAKSAGLPVFNADNLANTTVAAGLASAKDIGTNAMSVVKNLGGTAAGLVGSVSSKIDDLKGTGAALAKQLGVDTSKLAGLSPNLQSKITEELKDAAAAIPAGVDITDLVKNGLILNNIPTAALSNIPVTQPASIAPLPAISLSDLKSILDRGGSLANIPGASQIPGVAALLAGAPNLRLPEGLKIDSSILGDKLSSVQTGLGQITGQIKSVEASIGNIKSTVQGGLPTSADALLSVANKFGSVSSALNSPLDTLMKITKV